MTENDQRQLGKTLWNIADQLRGAMNADDFRDYMLAFLFLRYLSDNYEKAAKIPAELVAEINETGSRAMEAWKQARADNDFDSFRPWLERQFELNRNMIETIENGLRCGLGIKQTQPRRPILPSDDIRHLPVQIGATGYLVSRDEA